jgi:tight adherence protein B
MTLLAVSLLVFLTAFFFVLGFSGFLNRKNQILNEIVTRRLQEHETASSQVHLERRHGLSALPLLDRVLRKFNPLTALQIFVVQSGLNISPAALMMTSLFLSSLLFLVSNFLKWPLPVSFILGTAGFFLPVGHVQMKRQERFKKFSTGFPDAVGRMASSLRAGYSMQMAVEAVIQDSGNLIAEEFRKLLGEIEVGQNFETALKKMLGRIDTPDLRLFIASVIIQRESGGNLAELLDNLEATIRERFALRKELEAATAQAKLSGIVLSLLPVFVGLAVYFIHQDYMMFFFNDPVGTKLFWGCVGGQMMGILTIRKIVKIDM